MTQIRLYFGNCFILDSFSIQEISREEKNLMPNFQLARDANGADLEISLEKKTVELLATEFFPSFGEKMFAHYLEPTIQFCFIAQ